MPFSFPHLHAVGQLVAHPPLRTVSHPKDKKLPWPLPAPKRPLALGRGRIRIPGFVRSPPMLAIYDVAYSHREEM